MVKSKKMAALILAAMLAVSSSAAMAVTVSAEEDTAVAYSSEEKLGAIMTIESLMTAQLKLQNIQEKIPTLLFHQKLMEIKLQV